MYHDHVSKEEYKGYVIGIYVDECSECPLTNMSWGGKFLFAPQYKYFEEKKYNSMTDRLYVSMRDAEWDMQQNELLDEDAEITVEQYMDYLKQLYNAVLLVPLRNGGDGHLSIDYDIDFDDCRFAGFFYATAKDIDDMQGGHSDVAIAQEEKNLDGDLDILNAWGNGECYGYHVYKPGTEENEMNYADSMDSCWGFYGNDIKDNGLMEQAKDWIDWYIKDQQEKLNKISNPIQLYEFIGGEN